MKEFVLNDQQQQNNYGFKVMNSGIGLERFKDNPVCLNDHNNNTKDVLGTWTNLRFDGDLFLGTPVFNTQDPEGLEVVRKVQEGVIVGCSLGFDFNPDDFVMTGDGLVLTQCELKEISIVAVPSNARTIVLYDKKGNVLTDKEISNLCLKAKDNFNRNNMNKVLKHLQLSDNASEEMVIEAIKQVEAKLTAKDNELQTALTTLEGLQKEKNARLKAEFEQELSNAIKDGRIDAAGQKPFETIAETTGFENATQVLKSLPVRESVSDKIKSKESEMEQYDKMSWAELDKGGHLGKLKSDMPDYYQKRFEQHFNK